MVDLERIWPLTPYCLPDTFSVKLATEKMGPWQEFHREMVR